MNLHIGRTFALRPRYVFVLRSDRQFGPYVIRNQSQQLRRSLRGLEREGIRPIFKLSSPEEVEAVVIERHPLWNNKRTEHGAFDIIGDVHGCFNELVELMAQLGYTVNHTGGAYSVSYSGAGEEGETLGGFGLGDFFLKKTPPCTMSETPHKLENRLNQFEGVGLIGARQIPTCAAPGKVFAWDPGLQIGVVN